MPNVMSKDLFQIIRERDLIREAEKKGIIISQSYITETGIILENQ